MLVSHRYRFIYTKTFKTAGTSVESYFERFCMQEGDWEQLHDREPYESSAGIVGYRGVADPNGRRWWNHMPAALIRGQVGERVWNGYFKFCVIRNPYEKCISAFEHLGADYRIDVDSGVLSGATTSGMSAEQHRFLRWLQCKGPPVDRDKYVIDGEFCLDDVIRYESLDEEIQRVCRKLGLPWQPELLPTYKKGIRRQHATAANLYTPDARRFVERTFAFEIDRFQYSFPRLRSAAGSRRDETRPLADRESCNRTYASG